MFQQSYCAADGTFLSRQTEERKILKKPAKLWAMFDVHLPKTVRDFIFQNKMFSMSKKHVTETNRGSGETKFIVLLNEASRLCDLDYKFCNLFSLKVSLRKKLMGVLTFIFQTGIQTPPICYQTSSPLHTHAHSQHQNHKEIWL